MKFYAGIAPDHTPDDVVSVMHEIAAVRRGEGWWLRSGHGPGELGFERGAYCWAQVFLPWAAFGDSVPVYGATVLVGATPEALALSAEFYPKGVEYDEERRQLLACNCHVILGPNLNEPVSEVVCWTQRGSLDGRNLTGSANHALRIARAHGVKRIVNLRRADHRKRVESAIWAGAKLSAALAPERTNHTKGEGQ